MTYWKPDILIYHSPCDDGFGAAWAAHQQWGDAIEYCPATYGKPAPDVTGKHVLMADFSYPQATIEAMAAQAKTIVILDHHKTAQSSLESYALAEPRGTINYCDVLPLEDWEDCYLWNDASPFRTGDFGEPRCARNVLAIFDMERSGARMAWEFCNPADPVPLLIKLIEDRDLWRFAISETRAFSLYLRSHPYDFGTWSRIAEQLETELEATMAQAFAIEGFYDQKVAEIVRTAAWRPINNISVPVANCTWAFASDVAHALLEEHPTAPFAATYYDRGDGSRTFSLRSDDARMDVSAVARRYGGGGHRNAAGFEVPAL